MNEADEKRMRAMVEEMDANDPVRAMLVMALNEIGLLRMIVCGMNDVIHGRVISLEDLERQIAMERYCASPTQ